MKLEESNITQFSQKQLNAETDSKWLVSNKKNPDVCPIRLFKKYIMEKRNLLMECECGGFFLFQIQIGK